MKRTQHRKRGRRPIKSDLPSMVKRAGQFKGEALTLDNATRLL
jgi:hypothetical protein